MNDAANRTESDAQGTYIHLPDDHPLRKRTEYELHTPESPDFFGPVRRVNILVGPNNAGKSRFLRALHAAETFVRGPGPFHDWRRAREVAAALPAETLELLARIRGDGWPDLFPPSRSIRDSVTTVSPTREVVSSLSTRDVVEALRTPFPARESVVPMQMACHAFIAARLFGRRPTETNRTVGDDMVVHAWTDPSTDRWRQVLECAGRHYLRVLHEEPPSRRRQESIRVKYFPAFRTALSIFGDTNALESTLHDCYAIPPYHPDAIVTGRRLYDQFDQAIRGKRKDRVRFNAFETWLSTQFFSGADVTLVPRHTQGKRATHDRGRDRRRRTRAREPRRRPAAADHPHLSAVHGRGWRRLLHRRARDPHAPGLAARVSRRPLLGGARQQEPAGFSHDPLEPHPGRRARAAERRFAVSVPAPAT
jgi:hypothetical protein